MAKPKYVVVTPVRNEAKYVSETIDSVVAQTLLPKQWVIVDDGSTDGTRDILEAASRLHPWITTISRPDRGFRKSGGGVVEAFYDGYRELRDQDWDFLVKLDGDLSFEPDYFEKCLDYFADDARLGIGGGAIYFIENGQLKADSPDDPPFHVRGATKIYRAGCWKQIHPLVPGPGWDTVDEVRANMLGWRTRTFQDKCLIQHRATGAVDGAWATWFKNGLANYVTGYHPVFMAAKSVKCLSAKPRGVAAAALWAGFCWGYVKGQPHVADAPSVRFLRQQQIRRLLLQPGIYGRPWDRKEMPVGMKSAVGAPSWRP